MGVTCPPKLTWNIRWQGFFLSKIHFHIPTYLIPLCLDSYYLALRLYLIWSFKLLKASEMKHWFWKKALRCSWMNISFAFWKAHTIKLTPTESFATGEYSKESKIKMANQNGNTKAKNEMNKNLKSTIKNLKTLPVLIFYY